MKILSVLILMSLLSAAPSFADEWTKTFPVAGNTVIEIRTYGSAVRVQKWDRNEVQAQVVTSGSDHTLLSSRDIGDVRLDGHQIGKRLLVDVWVPEIHWVVGSINTRTAEIDVNVPEQFDSLEVNAKDGNVSVERVNGKINVHSGDGALALSRITGTISASSGGGDIQADSIDGSLSVELKEGNVHVSGKFDALNLRTGSGDITAEVKGGSKMTGTWSVGTDDGNVTVRLPDGFAAELDATAKDGKIAIDLPGQATGTFEKAARQKLNSGTALLRVRTGDGDISVGRS